MLDRIADIPLKFAAVNLSRFCYFLSALCIDAGQGDAYNEFHEGALHCFIRREPVAGDGSHTSRTGMLAQALL